MAITLHRGSTKSIVGISQPKPIKNISPSITCHHHVLDNVADEEDDVPCCNSSQRGYFLRTVYLFTGNDHSALPFILVLDFRGPKRETCTYLYLTRLILLKAYVNHSEPQISPRHRKRVRDFFFFFPLPSRALTPALSTFFEVRTYFSRTSIFLAPSIRIRIRI